MDMHCTNMLYMRIWIKTGIGYHEADENGIYWKQREFEQIWGGILINLRNFTEDGKG